jgi:hypothetical protein
MDAARGQFDVDGSPLLIYRWVCRLDYRDTSRGDALTDAVPMVTTSSRGDALIGGCPNGHHLSQWSPPRGAA